MIAQIALPNTEGHSPKLGSETTNLKVALFSEEFQKWEPSSAIVQGDCELSSTSVQPPTQRTAPHDFDTSSTAPTSKDTHFSSTLDPPPYSPKSPSSGRTVARPNVDEDEYARVSTTSKFHYSSISATMQELCLVFSCGPR
jgi:hypothetical protein